MLDQTMEVQAERKVDKGKNGRTVGIRRPTYDECRAINVILEPLELPDHGNESLHHVLNSPTDSESSSGSWSPIRRLYAMRSTRRHKAERVSHQRRTAHPVK